MSGGPRDPSRRTTAGAAPLPRPPRRGLGTPQTARRVANGIAGRTGSSPVRTSRRRARAVHAVAETGREDLPRRDLSVPLHIIASGAAMRTKQVGIAGVAGVIAPVAALVVAQQPAGRVAFER